MRITLLSHFPGRGGSTILLVQLAEFLRGLNHEIGVVVGDDCADPILREYAVVPRTPEGGWRRRMAAYVAAIRATRPDIVYSISGKAEFDVFRFLSCPRIRHVSSLEQHEFTDIPFWIRQVGRFADAFTANTPDVLERIKSWISGSARNSFVGWTVPYRLNEAFQRAGAVPAKGGPGNGGVVNVCFIGRLDRFQKRAHWLPEIVDRCQSFKRNFRWHIYGQGPLEASIKASLAQRKLLNNVCFYGWMDAAGLAARLPLQDVFFLCSRWEGLPIAMAEAMLCGLACVVPADAGGMTYALREGGGWLYNANSAAACATALVAATSDLKLLDQRKKEARIIARDLFSGRELDEQLHEFAVGLPNLAFNGNRIEVNQAPRMYSVHPMIALKRRLRRIIGIGRADFCP